MSLCYGCGMRETRHDAAFCVPCVEGAPHTVFGEPAIQVECHDCYGRGCGTCDGFGVTYVPMRVLEDATP